MKTRDNGCNLKQKVQNRIKDKNFTLESSQAREQVAQRGCAALPLGCFQDETR